MRIQRLYRTVVALVLVLSLMMSGCISAFAADKTEPVKVINGKMLINGVWVDVEVIDGHIKVINTASWDPALDVEKNENGTDKADKLEVKGSVINEQENRDATALYVNNSSENDLTVTIDENVSAKSEGSDADAYGVKVNTKGKDGETTVEIKKGITATAESDAWWAGATGLTATASGGASATITVGGSIDASAESKDDDYPYEYVTAIYGTTSGETSKLSISVQGDATATTASEDRNSTGITLTNKGGSIDVSVAGDVVSEGTGIDVSTSLDSTQTYLNKEEDIKEYKDKAVLTYTYSDGSKEYIFRDDNNVSGYYYINGDGSFNYGYKTVTKNNAGATTVTVGGSVEGSVNAATDSDDNSIDISVGKDVNGNVNAAANGEKTNVKVNVGNDVDGSVSASSAEGNNTTVTVKGQINNETESNWSDVYGLRAFTTNGKTGIVVGEDVAVLNKTEEYGGATAISAQTRGENSELTIKVGGDATAKTTSENYGSTGITATNKGGKIDINVTGDVVSEGTGINVTASADSTQTYLNSEEDIKEYKDKVVLAYTYSDGSKEYTFKDNNGVSGYYYINADGTFGYGYKTVTKNNAGTTTISVGGSVDGSVNATANSDDNSIDINIGKDVNGNVSAAANGEKTNVKINVGKDVEGSVSSSSAEGNNSIVTVNGQVNNEAELNWSTAYGLRASTTNGKTQITVGEDVAVLNKTEEYGRATAISAQTEGEDSELTIKVGGNAIAKTASEDYGSTGIVATNKGGTIDIDVAGDVVSNGTGISASTNNGKTDIHVEGDVSVESAGEKPYDGPGRSTTGIAVTTVGEDSDVDVHIGGDVSAKSTSGKRLYNGITTQNSGGEIAIEVDGDLDVDGNGIRTSTGIERKTEDITEDEIAALGEKAWEKSYGPGGWLEVWYYTEGNTEYRYYVDEEGNFAGGTKTTYLENNGSTDITVKGDLSVNIPKDYDDYDDYEASGINASSNMESQRVNVSVDGNVNISGGAFVVTGAKIDNHAGDVTVNVGGSVTSSGTGVMIVDETGTTYHRMTEAEIDSMKNQFKQYEHWEDVDEDGNSYVYESYGYVDENGNSYYYTTINGIIDYSEANIRKDKTTNNSLAVDGDVNSNRIGVSASVNNREGNDTISIGGDVNVEGQSEDWSRGITTDLYDGTLGLTVGGDVNVSSKNGGVTGINANVNGGEESIQIGGGVLVEGKPLDITYDVDYDGYKWGEIDAIQASVDGADSKLTISVADDVTAMALGNPEMATAIRINNYSEDSALGDLTLTVDGNVDSTGTGLYVDSGDSYREYLEGKAEVVEAEYVKTNQRRNKKTGEITEEKVYYNQEGDYYYNEDGKKWKEITPESGETNVSIFGDVSGDSIGVQLQDVFNTNILIDGTVSGNDSAILVSNGIIADSLNLTIWEIKPDAEGHYIESRIGTDEEGNAVMAENEYMLDQVQYIIRIEPTQADMIRTIGTTEQDGYLVAHENDTVTIKLNIPYGYNLLGVTGDVPRECQLLKDENGDYYLVVPRGGGVFISLNLRHKGYAKASFYLNGGTIDGTGDMFTKNVIKGSSINLPTPDEREGYSFAGWYASENGPDSENWQEPDTDESNLLPGATKYKMDEDMTFTAVWKSKE